MNFGLPTVFLREIKINYFESITMVNYKYYLYNYICIVYTCLLWSLFCSIVTSVLGVKHIKYFIRIEVFTILLRC